MPKMHPCCGGSLQTGTKIIAILHLVFAILFVIVGVITFSGGALITSASQSDQIQGTKAEREEVATAGAYLIFVSIVAIVVGILSIALAAMLLSGANKRNHTRCMIWFVLNAIFLMLTLLETIEAIISGRPGSGLTVAFNIVGILIDSYCLWVVWAFMEELKEAVEVAFYGSSRPGV